MLNTKFQPFPELITERLLLRQLNTADTPEIFFLRSDKNVLKYIEKEPSKSLDEAKTFIKTINQSIKEGETILWGIALRNNPGVVIGSICFWRLQKEHYRAEIGYALHPEYWRKGIMKEAIHKVLDYGFNKMKLHSVEAKINPENEGSAAILEATGFIREAYFKEDYCFKGSFFDTAVYSKLNNQQNVFQAGSNN
jgi:[ribosomal protein S5]-alanine N-acetyltransferase